MVRAILDGRKTQTRRIIKGNSVEVVQLMRKVKSLDGYDEQTGEYGICSTHTRVIDKHVKCPYGKPGDRLWVRETWSHTGQGVWTVRDARMTCFGGKVVYRADEDTAGAGWFPSIHMPKEFARIFLKVTDVRVQRLRDISEEDAIAEGIQSREVRNAGLTMAPITVFGIGRDTDYAPSAGVAFSDLWEEINGSGSWGKNPWVYALTFERVETLEDAA